MHQEKKAIRFASFGAGTLAILKLIFGIMSGSMVLIASAVDSLLDLIVSLFNLFALKQSAKPADHDHNYGHGKIEGIAAVIEALLIAGSGFFLIFSSIKKLIYGSELLSLELGILAILISLLVTGMIVFFLQRTAKTTNSLIVRADLIHYKMDFLTNGSVLLTLILVKITHLSIIDPIVAIAIAVYILFGCWKIFKEGIDLLMDKSLGQDEEIGALILAHQEIASFHQLKTRKVGESIFISFHMVFKDKHIPLSQAHQISSQVESSLRKQFKGATITVRLDPINDDFGEAA